MKDLRPIVIALALFWILSPAVARSDCDFKEFEAFLSAAIENPAEAAAMVDAYTDKAGCGCWEPEFECLRVKVNDQTFMYSRRALKGALELLPPWIKSADTACSGLPEGEEQQDREKIQCYEDQVKKIEGGPLQSMDEVARLLAGRYMEKVIAKPIERIHVLDKGRRDAHLESIQYQNQERAKEISYVLCDKMDALDFLNYRMEAVKRHTVRWAEKQLDKEERMFRQGVELESEIREMKQRFKLITGVDFDRKTMCKPRPEKKKPTLPFNINPTPTPTPKSE